MTIVAAGEFEMGSNDIVYAKPPHAVKIERAFAIGRREITLAEWDECVTSGACKHRPDDRGVRQLIIRVGCASLEWDVDGESRAGTVAGFTGGAGAWVVRELMGGPV